MYIYTSKWKEFDDTKRGNQNPYIEEENIGQKNKDKQITIYKIFHIKLKIE